MYILHSCFLGHVFLLDNDFILIETCRSRENKRPYTTLQTMYFVALIIYNCALDFFWYMNKNKWNSCTIQSHQ